VLDRTPLKRQIAANLDAAADELASFGGDIFEHAELGFREHRTAARVADELRTLGLRPEEGLAITGVKASLRGQSEGPRVAVLGELDGLIVPDHPWADPETGAAHACGHNAQLTHLLGVARALQATDAMARLSGEVVFMAVPAEEYVDLEWRLDQAKHGKLEFLGGKAELLRSGAFDGIDMALFVHAGGNPESKQLSLYPGATGLVAKRARFIGRASHAGAAPERGINALNAATLALQAIHLQRETFRDEDHIRVHPIVTHGGTTINVVPADVRLETFVRGASFEAITDAAAKVDRALKAGALAVGASVEIETLPGYLPLHVDQEMARFFKANALELVGNEGWAEHGTITASTDAGDLSHIMPMLHPGHGGCSGTNHAADFLIADPHVAYVVPAKAIAHTIVDLLADGAREAQHVLRAFQPRMSKQQYLAHMRGLVRTERFDAQAAHGVG
jgi:amidohydrolase